jgi:LPS-assembly protein
MPTTSNYSASLRPLVLALVAAFGAFAAPARADDTLGLRLQRELLPRPTDTDDRVPVFMRGDHMDGTTERETLIEGNAEVRRGTLLLRADRIDFQQVEDTLDAAGNVRLQTTGGHYTGPTLHYELDSERGALGTGEFYVNATQGHGSADTTQFEGHDVVRMTEARYSTCPIGDNSWFVRARELTIDSADQTGEARGATVVFKGVPILATPYISFPVGDQAKSGFLTPGFGVNTSSGLEFFTPYYFAIAPNRDDTLTPHYMTKRGLQLINEFRYLGQDYRGNIRAELLDKDQLTGERRWSFGANHAQTLGGGWGTYWNIDRVSDDDYVSDFSRTIVAVSNRQLTQEGGVTYGASYWNVLARVQKYQVLQDAEDPVAIPYAREPQITLNAYRYDRYGFDLTLTAEATRFTHPTYVTGQRLVVNPAISYPIVRPGGYLTPRVSYNLAKYDLDSARIPSGSLLDKNFSRAIPTYSVDSGLTFERTTHFYGNDLLQTLEPRLYYVYTPYRDQNGAQLFDTSLADFNFAQLFSENRYSGQDRISDANQLTAAVSSRLIDPQTGLERLRAVLGQRFYFDDQRVGLTTSTLSTASKSDVLASIGGEISETLSADMLLQYDAATNRTGKSSVGTRWTPERGKVFGFTYRFIRDELEQYDIWGQWRLARNWYGVGRINYSTYDRRLVEGLAGVEYDGGCWVLRLVAQRYVTSTNTTSTSFFFQLELNGFASVGSSPLDALRRSISGYQTINPAPGAVSRFVQYE